MSTLLGLLGEDHSLYDHYLGPRGARPRLIYADLHGLIFFASPSSRRLPTDWLELSRWCIKPCGLGSRQWSECLRWLRERSDVTTLVSYSDPSVGHDGALYRACGWVWAPVWHVLREPPSGFGERGGKRQRAKHRWVYLLRPDERRGEALSLKDEAIARRWPWIGYAEPAWKRGRPKLNQQWRYARWRAIRSAPPSPRGGGAP